MVMVVGALTSIYEVSYKSYQKDSSEISLLLILIAISFFPFIFFSIKKIPFCEERNFFSLSLLRICLYTALGILSFEFFLYGSAPLFSADPANARLEYGIPVIHTVAEILLRVSFLLWLSSQVKKYRYLFLIILFFILMAGRSSLIEILFVSFFYLILKKPNKTLKFVGILSMLTITIFYLLGEVRYGFDSRIEDTAEFKYEILRNPLFAWPISYLTFNFDNLLLNKEGLAGSDDLPASRVLNFIYSPLSHFFNIKKPVAIDEYDYVGVFNIGTGFFFYFLDFGAVVGFSVAFSVILSYCIVGKFLLKKGYYSLFAYVGYLFFSYAFVDRFLDITYISVILFSYILLKYWCGARAMRI